MEIRLVSAKDALWIVEIYNHYIATSHATFEVELIGYAEMLRRIKAETDDGYTFIVCVDDGQVVGYAYGHQYRPRPAYRHSVEVSVYIKPRHEGKNVGTRLYEKLIAKKKTEIFTR